MGHQDDAPGLSIHRFFKVLPSFLGVQWGHCIRKKEAIQKYPGEVMVLLPGTKERIEKSSVGENGTVKPDADSKSSRNKKKITCGDPPGEEPEYPKPAVPG
jgi:hypothetical protein